MMNFAICDWVPNLTERTLDTWQADGVTHMEPGPGFLLNGSEASIKADSKRLKAREIEIYSTHAPFGGKNDLSQLDDDQRKIALEQHVISLNQTSAVGGRCLVIHPSGRVPPAECDQRLGQLRKSLEALLVPARTTGVRLALENMPPGLLCYDAALLRDLVDEFDSPSLGICFDTGHANIGNSNASQAFTLLRKRIVAFHLHDNDGHGDRHLQPPYGTINWETLAAGIRDMGFEHPMSIEAPPWAGVSFGMQLREMKALFAGEMLAAEIGNRNVRLVCSRCGRYCFGTEGDSFCGCNETSTT